MDQKQLPSPSSGSGLLLPFQGMSLSTTLSSSDIEHGSIENILPKAMGSKNEADLKKIVSVRLGNLKDQKNREKFHEFLSEEDLDVIQFVEGIMPVDWSEMVKGPIQGDVVEYAHFKKGVSITDLIGDFDETDGCNWGIVMALICSENELDSSDAVTLVKYGIRYVTCGAGIDEDTRRGIIAGNIYTKLKGKHLDVSSLSGDMATVIDAISKEDNEKYLSTVRSMWAKYNEDSERYLSATRSMGAKPKKEDTVMTS